MDFASVQSQISADMCGPELDTHTALMAPCWLGGRHATPACPPPCLCHNCKPAVHSTGNLLRAVSGERHRSSSPAMVWCSVRSPWSWNASLFGTPLDEHPRFLHACHDKPAAMHSYIYRGETATDTSLDNYCSANLMCIMEAQEVQRRLRVSQSCMVSEDAGACVPEGTPRFLSAY